MKVYILYETKDADEYGFSRRDDVVGVYSTRKKAEKALKEFSKEAEEWDQDKTYNVIPEEVK